MSKAPQPDPFFWHETGSNLFQAANFHLRLLDELDPSTHVVGLPEARNLDHPNPYREQARKRTHWMLVGMAVENWLKGLIVAASVDARQIWPTHDLAKLALAAGLDLEEEDEKFLTTLAGAVRWAGRYPSPNRDSELHDFNEECLTKERYERVAKKILDRHDELDKSFDSTEFDQLD
ncbi:MAG: hypothetical protein AB1725_06415 [Armatimonadota bacterium]